MSSFRSRIRGRKPSLVSSTSSSATSKSDNNPESNGSSITIYVDNNKDTVVVANEKSCSDGGTDDDAGCGIVIDAVGADNHHQHHSLSVVDNESDLTTNNKGHDIDSGTIAAPEERTKESSVLLTDPKFKNNRIEKSSSRGKMYAIATNRKISAPPAMETVHPGSNNAAAAGAASPVAKKGAKGVRSHSNLNLKSLSRYRALINASFHEKKLSAEDFDHMRQESLSEVAKVEKPTAGKVDTSVKLIGHKVLDEGDEKSSDILDGEQMPPPPPPPVIKGRLSLTDKVAAKLTETAAKRKRSKSKSTKKRKGSRRSSINTSSNNVPVLLNSKCGNVYCCLAFFGSGIFVDNYVVMDRYIYICYDGCHLEDEPFLLVSFIHR